MFSAIKRLAKGDSPSNTNTNAPQNKPQSHQSMSTVLQKKFSKGVQYNMKIIIKGDRNVGKTCLFHRLQGLKFVEEYIPTEEIQVTSIQWNYKAADDIVKVEVWDVVDKGKKKKKIDGLKLNNSKNELPEEPALDAEFLDVYKGTNGVILMMDLTKTWTFDYVQRELPKIPPHIPVIILANHCDMSHHRTVTSDHVTFFIESVIGSRSAQVRYAESSMRNGFGLKLLHKFFNLPYLQLQRESLLTQLERNGIETNATVQELDMYCDSDEANYDKFMENVTKKRREIADSNGKYSVQQLEMQNSASCQQIAGNQDPVANMKRSQSCSIVIGAGKPIPFGNLEYKKSTNSLQNPTPGKSSSQRMLTKEGENLVSDLGRLNIAPITSVEEFVPDGGQLDRGFLDDTNTPSIKVEEEASDSDTDTGNPLVSELQEDFEPEDFVLYAKPRVHQKESNESEKHVEIKDDLDSTLNSEISEITSDPYDAWLGNDTKLRRSPEGGEDVSTMNQSQDFNNSYDEERLTSPSANMELLSSKRSPSPMAKSDDSDSDQKSKKKKKKDKDKKDKKYKSKKSKDKDSKDKQEKKSKRRSRDESSLNRDELEEFLNGSGSPQPDGAYEAI